MPQRYKRHFLKAKEVKSILKEASRELKADLNEILGDEVEMELVKTDFCQFLLIKGNALLVRIKKKILPTLIFSEFINLIPKVVVDMGAVPYVCNGADIMAPGIVRYEGEFRETDLVQIVDEKHGKTIAIGTAHYDLNYAKNMNKGMVVSNIHFIGDRIWNLIKKLKVSTINSRLNSNNETV